MTNHQGRYCSLSFLPAIRAPLFQTLDQTLLEQQRHKDTVRYVVLGASEGQQHCQNQHEKNLKV